MSEELADFAAAVRDVPELRSVLRNPQLDPRAKVGVLDDADHRRLIEDAIKDLDFSALEETGASR